MLDKPGIEPATSCSQVLYDTDWDIGLGLDVVEPKVLLFDRDLALSTSYENTVGIGKIARYVQFLLFPQYFLPFCKTFRHFYQIWIVGCNPVSLEEFKICYLGKG